MDEPTVSFRELAIDAKDLARRLLTIGENRLELLAVEIQEERLRLLHALLLSLGVAVFSLLASLTLTAAIVVVFWAYSPMGVLLALTVLYGAAAGCLAYRLTDQLRDWRAFASSLDQLQKDRAGLEKFLS